MSLQVWLPLNGDLHNQGLNNFTITNNGATINNNGKIGKCYYFNGDKQWLQFSTSLGNFYNNDWSFAVWLKPTDSTRSVILSEYNGAGASNVAIELTTARIVRIYWNGSPDIFFTTAGGLPINEWTHLIITKQSSIFKIYFNGILKQTYAYDGTLSTRISNCQPRIGDDYRGNSANTVSYQGYMNDFRLYDHCLSAAEAAEIAKGLILHYKLDNNGLGNENYWANGKPQINNWTNLQNYPNELRTTYARTNASYTSSPSTIPNEYTEIKFLSTRKQVNNGVFQFQKVQRYNNTYNGMCPILENLKEGEYFTIGYEFYTSSPVNVNFGFTKRISGTTYKQIGASKFQVSTINTWTKISQSIQITSDFDKSNMTADVDYLLATIVIQDILGVTTPGEVVMRIRNIKLEKGQEATSWTPAKADFSHIDDNIIYDYSGYGNNGTIVGELTVAAGSPRYRVATQFPGTTYSKCVSPSTEGQTISVWAKWDSIPSGQSIIYIDYKTKTGLGLMSTGILCSSCGLNSYTFSKTAIMANTWYHFVIVCPNGSENATRQLYINGVEQTATNNTSNWTYAIDELQIGKRSTTSDGFNGQLSDFRIYATALTSEQVVDLYHTSMSIDNQGNTYARELVE